MELCAENIIMLDDGMKVDAIMRGGQHVRRLVTTHKKRMHKIEPGFGRKIADERAHNATQDCCADEAASIAASIRSHIEAAPIAVRKLVTA